MSNTRKRGRQRVEVFILLLHWWRGNDRGERGMQSQRGPRRLRTRCKTENQQPQPLFFLALHESLGLKADARRRLLSCSRWSASQCIRDMLRAAVWSPAQGQLACSESHFKRDGAEGRTNDVIGMEVPLPSCKTLRRGVARIDTGSTHLIHTARM